jgi:hypothetical protein
LVSEISSESSVWETVSLLQKSNSEQISVYQPETNSRKQTNLKELMDAFFTAQKLAS